MRLIDLTPLHEIDFRNQAAFDTYNKQHKLRPDTKVNIAGKNTTAGQAAQSSTPVKGTSVFGNDKKDKEQQKQFKDLGINRDKAVKAHTDAEEYSKRNANGKYKPSLIGDDFTMDMIKMLRKEKFTNIDDNTAKLLSKLQKTKGEAVVNTKTGNISYFLYDGSKYEMNIDTKNKSVTTKEMDDNKKSDTSLSSMIPNKATQKYDPATAFNQKVSKMTDNNDHSAAAVELAIYMDDKEAVQKLQQIKKLRDNRGYLRPSEAKERGEMVNTLLQRAQKELPKKDFDLVSSAF